MTNLEIKNSIIVISEKPILNPTKTHMYQNLSINYTVYLNTLLFSNWVELLSTLDEQFEIIFFLDKTDKEYLSNHMASQKSKIVFYDNLEHDNFSEEIEKHISDHNSKSLILFNNSIGMNRNDINRSFNLIQSDEPSLVIGKSITDQIIFISTLGIDSELIAPILKSNRSYSQYLNSIGGKDIFINTLDNFLTINGFEDIKKLYIELSKKESLSYCSQKMHESFNDLFIEYKDSLNG